jgi:ribonuclease HII
VGTTRRAKTTVGSVPIVPRYRAGIDENGLGASLGPLVITAVIAEVTERGVRSLNRWGSRSAVPLLGDSKQLIRHGDVRLGEAWARTLTRQSTTEPLELLEQLSSVPLAKLMARCPKQSQSQCWHTEHDEFLASDELIDQVRIEMSKLEGLGIRPCQVCSRLVCTDELNARGQTGENRFLVDLHCMEDLIGGMLDNYTQPVGIVCGKVGGMHDYTRHFDKLGSRNPIIVTESKKCSVYRISDLAEIKFLRDADSVDPLVMLASLVGKYLRELFVSRIGSHFSNLVSDIRKPSGYHDKVTQDFVKATGKYRRQSAFPSSCFERFKQS